MNEAADMRVRLAFWDPSAKRSFSVDRFSAAVRRLLKIA